MWWTALERPEGVALLAILLSGHVFGDFLLQTQRVADLKERRLGALLLHGGLMLVAHLAVLAPVLTWQMTVLVLMVALLHTVTDAIRARVPGGASLAAFFCDQAIHVALLVAVWSVLAARAGWMTYRVSGEGLVWYARCLAVASAYVFNARGGTAIVRKTLGLYPDVAANLGEGTRRQYAMGRVIGNLERFVLLTLLLFWQWGAIGFVVAAKSIARFPELRDSERKDFTEYYLIGTLTSILVALGSAILLRAVLVQLAGGCS